MTEQEWESCDDLGKIGALLTSANGITPRKFDLFLAELLPALARRSPCRECREAMSVMSVLAEEELSPDEQYSAIQAARMQPCREQGLPDRHWGRELLRPVSNHVRGVVVRGECWNLLYSYTADARYGIFRRWLNGGVSQEERQRAHQEYVTWASEDGRAAMAILRELRGNPFKPLPAIDPDWLRWGDGTVVRMAQQIYDRRNWSDMPILADALFDAGCADEELLSHACKQGAVHVRGCWLLDRLLKKE